MARHLCRLCARYSETDRCAKRTLRKPSCPSCLRGENHRLFCTANTAYAIRYKSDILRTLRGPVPSHPLRTSFAANVFFPSVAASPRWVSVVHTSSPENHNNRRKKYQQNLRSVNGIALDPRYAVWHASSLSSDRCGLCYGSDGALCLSACKKHIGRRLA